MANIFVGAVLLALVGAAAKYIVKEKRKGVKCIGCPACGNCSRNQKCCSEKSD